jgi:hypothetical protein
VLPGLALAAGWALICVALVHLAREPDPHQSDTAEEFLRRNEPATAWTGDQVFGSGS